MQQPSMPSYRDIKNKICELQNRLQYTLSLPYASLEDLQQLQDEMLVPLLNLLKSRMQSQYAALFTQLESIQKKLAFELAQNPETNTNQTDSHPFVKLFKFYISQAPEPEDAFEDLYESEQLRLRNLAAFWQNTPQDSYLDPNSLQAKLYTIPEHRKC